MAGQRSRLRRTANSKQAERFKPVLHPIPPGTKLVILRVRADGPFIEGRARTVGVARGRNRYRVKFDGDCIVRERIVHPDYQPHPDRMLEILTDLWRASNTEQVSEFFPDDGS